MLAHEVTGRFFGAVVSEARRQRLLSEEHFSVDGTLLEAWASLKSVRPRDEEGDPPTGAGGLIADVRLSKFRGNVRLIVQQKCPSLSLRWYQMLVLEEFPVGTASADSRRRCISLSSPCGCPTPSDNDCPWASGTCTLTFKESSSNAVDPLTDADADTPGVQVDLAVGDSKILMYVYEGGVGTGNYRTYSLAATRASSTPATGAPTISGTAQAGQTLTADTSGISDADGLDNVTYSYQWLADDTEIDGATSSTHTHQASDNGKVIKVQVTFTDDEGYEESLTSDGTAAVVMGGL